MRRVADRTALDPHGRVLKSERTLLICMAFGAGRVCACSQALLFALEPAVRVVTIRALDNAFEHLVAERHRELSLLFRMTLETQLDLVVFEQPEI